MSWKSLLYLVLSAAVDVIRGQIKDKQKEKERAEVATTQAKVLKHTINVGLLILSFVFLVLGIKED